LVSFGVGLCQILVHRTVHFDNQADRMTVEIHDESINHMLASKVQSVQSVAS